MDETAESWYVNLPLLSRMIFVLIMVKDCCEEKLSMYKWLCTIILVNIGSGNDLLPDGTKPLPETMLSSH